MKNEYTTVLEGAEREIVEKKSRFIGELRHVDTMEEAEAFWTQIRKKYYDARHHCFACVVGEPGSPSETLRYSDDGEPQGTAGKPMLEVLTGAGLHYTAVVVTRYFGGTLLGTGGLVRAYTRSAQEALAAAELITIVRGKKLVFSCTYPQSGKLQYLIARENLPQPGMEYGERVTVTLRLPAEAVAGIRKKVIDATDGQAVFLSETDEEYII